MDIGASCKQCGGRGGFGGSAFAYPGQRSYVSCELCNGTGLIGGQPATEEFASFGHGVQISAAALYAEADAQRFADDAIAADREKYGRWISGELVMPIWRDGQPIYERHH